jgi:hypothetical protein
MIPSIDTLPEAQRRLLHDEFQALQPTRWVSEIARQKDWRAANEEFLRHERGAGKTEMQHLMTALGLSPPISAETAADLTVAAVTLLLAPTSTGDFVWRVDERSVRLRICACPTLKRLEAQHGRGVTACGSWHRRKGWYEAMGIRASDSVLAESIWGDEACEALIDFGPLDF